MEQIALSALDKWWTHLSTESKELVSDGIPYPECTAWWLGLDNAVKADLYDRFGGRSAHVHHTRPSNMQSYT